jgi:hypothetical protein
VLGRRLHSNTRATRSPPRPGPACGKLMGRMGHSTTRAALIYQHRTSERDRLIAEAVSKLAEQELSRLTGSQARNGHGPWCHAPP